MMPKTDPKYYVPLTTLALGVVFLTAGVLQELAAFIVILMAGLLYLLVKSPFIKALPFYNYGLFVEIFSGIAILILCILVLFHRLNMHSYWVALTLVGVQLWVLRWSNKKA